MDTNPYQSPREESAVDDAQRRRHGLIGLIVIGAVMGLGIAACAGAVCCAVLGAAMMGISAVVHGLGGGEVLKSLLLVPFAFGIAGGIVGAGTGAIVGGVLGGAARFAAPTHQSQLVISSCALSGIAGGGWGAVLAMLFTQGPGAIAAAMWLIAPTAGIAAGILGGRTLGNALSHLAWETE